VAVAKGPKKTQVEEPLEKKLWQAADKLRKNMDAAEYKHIVLGLIFLKYISDAFEELHQKLVEHEGEFEGADPEDKNEYTAEKVFYVPPSARWQWLQGRAKLPTIGKDVDDAMLAIERDNPSLRGVLPTVFAQEKLMVVVRRTLRKYGYPPDKQEKAIDTVLKQAEVMAEYYVGNDSRNPAE
jgi:type I restriction enzyme M protein